MLGSSISPPLNSAWDRLHTKEVELWGEFHPSASEEEYSPLPVSQFLRLSASGSQKTMLPMKPVCVFLLACALHLSRAW